jgi:predicted RNA-binding protein YlqC (UPF0109 family)
MENLVEFIAKKLVQHPEDVQVRKIEGEGEQTLELRVNEEDMGRVIGRSGRTAKALRTVLSAAASKADVHATFEIVE